MNEFLLGMQHTSPIPAGALWLDIDPTPLPVGSTAFVDNASGLTITRGGNGYVTAQVIDTASQVKGLWINSTNGRSWFTVPYVAGKSLNMTAGDMTIEFWVKVTSDNRSCLAGNWIQTSGKGGWIIWRQPGGQILFGFGLQNENGSLISSVNKVPLNTLAHIAIVRKGATFSLYINGVLDSVAQFAGDRGNVGAATAFAAYQNSAGNYPDSVSSPAVFYIAKIRMYAGYAKYTGNFIPIITD